MDFELDSYWLDAIGCLNTCIQKNDVVLAPNAFKKHFQGFNVIDYRARINDVSEVALSYIVVHKGLIDRIKPDVLDTVDQSFFPIFANEVFVIFSGSAHSELCDQVNSEHLQAYWDARSNHKQESNKALANGTVSNLTELGQSTQKAGHSSSSQEFLTNIDVLLLSYRKCGRTWLRSMLASYINEKCQLRFQPDLKLMDKLVPPFAIRDSLPLDMIQTDQYRGKFGLKAIAVSHKSYDTPNAYLNLKGKDIIFLFRSVCDVLVSQYFERVYRGGYSSNTTVGGFIQSENLLESYIKYLNIWADYLDYYRHLIVTYEGIKADTLNTFHRVLQFLGTEVDEDVLAHAIQFSSFENMQTMQRKKMMQIKKIGFEETSKETARLRTRRGKIGGYRDYLSESEVMSIREYCEKELSAKAKAMFEAHHLDVV